ncbi:BgTH12-07467 [Blumeria graminis f. sp. triticale]|nr:BgTH12-07467 [Blumeria graminis f. sp. triticale]
MFSSADPTTMVASAHPTLAIKQSNQHLSPMSPAAEFSTMGLVTRKEWVIPPRPKPGRKPATDTPPTKRKAQNRAAQRAFRERRAARVGELEEQLEESKEEQKQREADLRSKIQQLEADVRRFRGELNSWRLRCENLDKIAQHEKREKNIALAELDFIQKSYPLSNITSSATSHLNHTKNITSLLPERVSSSEASTQTETRAMKSSSTSTETACAERIVSPASSGCCGTPSMCLNSLAEEDDEPTKSHMPIEYKRSYSPDVVKVPEKRMRQSVPSTEMETDFTNQFTTKVTPIENQPSLQIPMIESCGFCNDATFCICAEAVDAPSLSNSDRESWPQPFQNTTFPEPQIDANANFIKLPALQAFSVDHLHSTEKKSPRKNGPGSCQQCQLDPRSGEFCRSLSELRGVNSKIQIECCGNKSSEDCCKVLSNMEPTELTPRLSCADVYKTLSSHRNFDQANNEQDTWLGKLHALPPVHPSRAPIEVEAASVMGVLKLFDRRFGRG